MKRSFAYTFGVSVLVISVSVLFQNCQAKNLDQSTDSVSAADENANTSKLDSNVDANSADEETGNLQSSAPKLVFTASSQASLDCSQPGATLRAVVSNSDRDILVCSEYILDELPKNDPRYNEKFTCTDADFVQPPKNWVYNRDPRIDAKTWLASETVTNSAYLVPGTFRYVVKTADGEIYKSPEVKIRRPGYAHCQPQQAQPVRSAGSRRCAWSGGIVIGPTENYAILHKRSCETGNETYSHTEAGQTYNYRCICTEM